jgi:hypothetical protein
MLAHLNACCLSADNNGNRDACGEFFARYRECTKARRERLVEERRKQTARK